MSAAPSVPPQYVYWLQQLFAFDGLAVRQRLLTIAQKYDIEDEWGRPRFHVVRPPKLLLNAVIGIAATLVNLLIFFVAFRLFFHLGQPLAAAMLLFFGGLALQVMAILLAPLRHIAVYADAEAQHLVLTLMQDNKLGLTKRFILYDALGGFVARLERDNIRSFWRREWTACTADGRPIAICREDRLVLALLRRYLGPMWGLLRTNFDILFPDGTVAGQYNRQLTLTDQYRLTLPGDPARYLDRRVVLALCILLDTGESR